MWKLREHQRCDPGVLSFQTVLGHLFQDHIFFVVLISIPFSKNFAVDSESYGVLLRFRSRHNPVLDRRGPPVIEVDLA